MMAKRDQLHEALRAALQQARRRRNLAQIANANAINESQEPPFSDSDLSVLRLMVDIAALEARNAGVNIDDIAGPNVGQLRS